MNCVPNFFKCIFRRQLFFEYDKLKLNHIALPDIVRFYSKNKIVEMKYLNVAEKHDAAKNIASILSNGSARRREGLCVYNKVFDFEANVRGQNCKMVMTSVSGHLLNFEFLPSYKGWKNCSPEQLFDAPIRKNISNVDTGEKIKRTIEREIRGCQGLIIWTDCDREGENIGFEVIEVCQAVRPNLKIFRAKFSEITRAGICRALNNLIQPDRRQNEAVNIRQELDLRTGAAFTRYQTLRLQRLFPGTTADKLISYGSCQIPTLGFVAERYKEVEDFESEPFWKLKVIHTIDDLTVEFNWARNRLFNKEAVEDYLLLCLADSKAKVENKTVKPINKWRPQPMDTVELEKLGSRKLKINAKEIMNIAEKLYNKGLISYPRTETNSFSSEINLKSLVEQHTSHSEWGAFASRVLEWGPNPRNGKKTDEAHPPIHPTKFTTGLDGNEARVYELIVRHFLACISKDATGSETIVYIDIAGEKFNANGLVIYERNYLDVYPYEKWNAKQIHHYDIDQIFEPTEISMQEGATTAPPLLTEADLIALMEKHGIGTDATHAEHIHTIKERGYIGEIERGLLVPGTIGMGLYEGYGAMDLELAKPKLRAEFESDLKKICNGEKDPQAVLREQIIKYKEAYNLITQRISAMDEKFALRVNETPSNRRNDDDRDPGGNSNRNPQNDPNNRRDSSDDDNDDGNNPPRGGGGIISRQNTNTNDDFIPQPMQEVFPCPKCKTYDMVLKKKKDGNSYMIGCNSFPDCKNVIWFPEAIKEARLTNIICNSCGNKTNQKSLSKKVEFKFKSNTYLALLGALENTYTCCIRCDSNFREIFDINLDQVKWAGCIVSNVSHKIEVDSVKTTKTRETKPNNNLQKQPKTKSKTVPKTKEKIDRQKRDYSTNSHSKPNPEEESIGWVFDDADDDLFQNAGFEDEIDDAILTSFGTSFEENQTSSTSNSNEVNSSKFIDRKNFKSKSEIDAYFTSWGKSSSSDSNRPNLPNTSSGWGTSQNKVNNQNTRNNQYGSSNLNKSSKWTNLVDSNFENKSTGKNWFSDNSFPNEYSMEEPLTKRYKNNDYSENDEPQIKCTTCNKNTKKMVVRKEGPNTGREFYACDASCKFFQWADEEPKTKNFNKSGSQRGNYSKTLTAIENCNCNKPAISLVVRKEGPNLGRPFITCSNNKKCGFFKWMDEEDMDNSFGKKPSTNSWGTKNQTNKNQKDNDGGTKKRKCGLCRMEGHTKNKCPRKEEFSGY